MQKLKIIRKEDADNIKNALENLLSVTDKKIEEVFDLRKKLPFQKTPHLTPLATKTASEISRVTGLDKRDSRLFLGTFVSLARFADRESASKFKTDMKTLGFKSSEMARVDRLLALFRKNGFDKEVKNEDDISKSSTALLPYLAGISWECDVRYSFSGKKVKRKVPIALIRLDLDADDEKERKFVRFQTNLDVLKLFIRDLRETYNKLALLEKM